MDRDVIATALQLFEARHFPTVIALVTDTLDHAPAVTHDYVDLLALRARAHIALRRDLDAQADLREVLKLDPRRGVAYRLLGQLAARRAEHESAAIFFREAIRLDPSDREAADWLAIVTRGVAPGGRFPRGTQANAAPREVTHERARSFARGTAPEPSWRTPTPRPDTPLPLPPPPAPGWHDTPVPLPPPPGRLATRPVTSTVVERPGFGDYLVATGVLTRERLRAAQAYQRSMKVQLATAIVTLGLATAQRIEYAAVAHAASR